MTKYYFYTTNADNGIIATNGTHYYNCAIDSDGNDINTGINIYHSNFDALREAYKELHNDGSLYDFSDIERDYPEKIYRFNENEFDSLKLIIEFSEDTTTFLRDKNGKQPKIGDLFDNTTGVFQVVEISNYELKAKECIFKDDSGNFTLDDSILTFTKSDFAHCELYGA